MKKVLITGGAGFIGSHLCDALIAKGYYVVCVDNLQRGDKDNIKHLENVEDFKFVYLDVNETEKLTDLLKKEQIEKVYHLAANTDLWESMKNPSIEDECTFSTTKSLLIAMVNANVHDLFFASTSAIYGNDNGKAFSENDLLMPISYYGAAKMASEAYIYAYAFMNDIKTVMFRFSNIIGSRMTHGVIRDFIERLLDDPTHLDVRGNGYQTKPFLHVSDLIKAITMDVNCSELINIFNVGSVTETNVRYIADGVVKEMGLEGIPIRYEESEGGWKGDVSKYSYNVDKIKSLGWDISMTSDETVSKAVSELYIDALNRRK